MSMHVLVLEIKKLLKNLDGWLDKAVEHSQHKKFDVNTLLTARLAPDMLPLGRQLQLVCDHAKWAAARTAGKEAPSHPDTEQTVTEHKARIANVVAYLDTFTAKDFEGIDDRSITMPRWEGKSLSGTSFLVEYALPNFYFHLTTAYAVLRHNGVEVGKRDYIGALSWR
jgi:uncharacterized protein